MEDFSVSNPKLHRLYVQYAIETLTVMNAAIEELNSHSRIQSSEAAGALMDKRSAFIKEDAAYREAAAAIMGQFQDDYLEKGPVAND